MLLVQVPAASALQHWTGTSLELKLAFSLREVQIPRIVEQGVGGGRAEFPYAFDADFWQEYFSVVVDEPPPLPADMEDIRDGEVPFLLDG